jgi:prophage regulatory protein
MQDSEDIIRRGDLKRLTGLSMSTIYRLIERGDFPKPIKLSFQAVGWTRAAIAIWLAGRQSVSHFGE